MKFPLERKLLVAAMIFAQAEAFWGKGHLLSKFNKFNCQIFSRLEFVDVFQLLEELKRF